MLLHLNHPLNPYQKLLSELLGNEGREREFWSKDAPEGLFTQSTAIVMSRLNFVNICEWR